MKKQTSGLVIFLTILLLGVIGGSDSGYHPGSPWPCFRHDYLNTGRADDIFPSRMQSQDSAPRWDFRTRGPIFSTPVIGPDGTVYVGSGDFNFYALKPSGELRWLLHTDRLIDSAAAISADGRVYVPGGDGKVYALDAETGKIIWTFSSRNVKPDQVAMANWFEGNVSLTPEGLVLAGNDDFCLYGIGPDGASRFTSCAKGMVWSAAPTAADGSHFFCTLDMNCYGVNKNGVQLWKTGTWGIVSASPAIGQNGAVYVTSFDGRVYALDPGTGKKRWSFKTGDHVYGSVAIAADGTIYIGSCDGAMYALLDRGDHAELKWAYDTLDPIRSSPVIDGEGRIYFGNGDGKLFVLGPDGRRQWSVDLTETDRNDINASIALGRPALYLAMEDGRVIQLPYDYCQKPGRDPRCSTEAGEDLPREGEFVYWMTPGGSSQTTSEVMDNILPGNVIMLRLLVRKNNETVQAGVEKKGLEVTISPPFPHHVTVAMDHRFINIVPEKMLIPGQEYTIQVRGRYREPGLKLLGHIWLTAGRRLGTFAAAVKFRAAKPENAQESAPALLLTHLSFFEPMIFPSVAQVGLDDLNFMVRPVEQRGDSEWIAWVMLARPDEKGLYRVTPGTKICFPVWLTLRDDIVLMEGRDFAFDHAGDRFGFNLLRMTGRPEKAGEPVKLSKNSLYAEGKSLSMAGSFYNVPVFGTPLAGTVHINYQVLPPVEPGLKISRVYLTGNKVIAEYINESGLKAQDHHLAILLLNKKTGEPIKLDYPKATLTVSDAEGRAKATELVLKGATTGMKKRLRAIVILDGAVLAKVDFKETI